MHCWSWGTDNEHIGRRDLSERQGEGCYVRKVAKGGAKLAYIATNASVVILASICTWNSYIAK